MGSAELSPFPDLCTSAPKNSESFVPWLKDRMEAGEFRAVIDRVYPLDDIVDAYRYVETEQKAGIVIVDVTPTDS